MEAPAAGTSNTQATNPQDQQFMLRYPRINANFRNMDVSSSIALCTFRNVFCSVLVSSVGLRWTATPTIPGHTGAMSLSFYAILPTN